MDILLWKGSEENIRGSISWKGEMGKENLFGEFQASQMLGCSISEN